MRFELGAHPVIDCHYRGAGKLLEVARIDNAEMAATLAAALAQCDASAALFIATDKAAFLDYVRATFLTRRIISADYERSSGGRALHNNRNTSRGLRQAGEALIDSLLLARCDLLVKTSAVLSVWSRMFNPQLPIRFVGKTNNASSCYLKNIIVKTDA